jgi:hypothetical protein
MQAQDLVPWLYLIGSVFFVVGSALNVIGRY